jgi:exopolyphosphatase/guanosine-5'-triphosphate,3'-diphosphate pyrophosphatase
MSLDPNAEGPFGVPLFNDAKARALSRVGVIDIGSNSVRMVVFDGAARSPAYFYNEKVMCGLGEGFSRTGMLHPTGKARAQAALVRFAALARAMDVKPLLSVATAAVRDARDGPEFRRAVLDQTGLDIRIIDGAEEARLSAQGVLLGWPGAVGLICDIGGSSMELAELNGGGQIGLRRSSDLGPLKLMGLNANRDDLRAHITTQIDQLCDDFTHKPKRLFLVGGSWRAIAKVDMARRDYPLKVLHEYRMTPAQLRDTVAYIRKTPVDMLKSQSGSSEARMRLVPMAAQVLKVLVRRLNPKEIAISSYGLREGLLYQQMDEALRHRDPLVEAARHSEAQNARMPGFGRALYHFIAPLFSSARADRLRVIRAACLLHDVGWRGHPDYRAEMCFDNATRANLGGLTHGERVYLGLALFHRYKSSRADTLFDDRLLSLLPDRDVAQAEILGRAMRFGAMFEGAAPNDHGKLSYKPKRKELILKLLSQQGRDLMGETAQVRFEALASAIDAQPVIKS